MTASLRARLTLWYAVSVGAVAALPYLAPVLRDAGFTPSTIAASLALLPLGNLLFAPMWSWAADRFDARMALLGATTGSALATLAVALAPTPTALIAGVAGLALCRPGVFPIADATTIRLLGEDRRSYGRIRAVGSSVFAVAIFSEARLREVWPRGPIWVGVCLMTATAFATLLLPSVARATQRPRLSELLRVARDPVLAGLAAAAVLHGMTLATYDHLFTLHVERLGLAPSIAGTAFAVGVVVEVGVLWSGRTLLARLGPATAMVLAIASGVPRWLATGLAPSAPLLIAGQTLHGIGFGAFWLGGVALFSERAPEGLAASSQALFTVATYGLGYLTALLFASVVLRYTDTSTLFLVLACASAAATILALALGRRAGAPVTG